jgi:hypothetical protein
MTEDLAWSWLIAALALALWSLLRRFGSQSQIEYRIVQLLGRSPAFLPRERCDR